VKHGMWIPHVPRPSLVSASVAARLAPPALDDSVVRTVLERYGLRRAGRSHSLPLARRSRNVVVRTDRGEKVLRQYRRKWSEETVRYVHSILLRLRDVGFIAPAPDTAADGLTWTRIGDELFGVFGVLPGKNYSVNYLLGRDRLRLTTIAGQTLARMHLLLDGFVPDGGHHVGLVSPDGSRRRDLAWYAAKLDELRDRSSALTDDESRALSNRLIRSAPAVLAEIALVEASLTDVALPRLVIHGDYGIHNLLFQRDGTAVPVDFELSRLDLRLNDLVSALVRYQRTGSAADRILMQTFVGAYSDVFPLSPDELAVFADAWRSYTLDAAVQYWNSYFETSRSVHRLRSALSSIERAQWVASHREVVGGLVRAAEVRAAPSNTPPASFGVPVDPGARP
jgi:Ser/Thr protein kinase RdoA (MazF antagonist)